jgi:hypothetical protein
MRILALLVVPAISLLAACSGGGSSGSGSARTGARVLHAHLGVESVYLTSSQQAGAPLQTASFADSTSYAGLSIGTQQLALTRSGAPGSALASFGVDVVDSERRSLLLCATDSDAAQVVLLNDVVSPLPAQMSAVRLVHGLKDSASLTLAHRGGANLATATRCSATDYQQLASGAYSFRVFDPQSGALLGSLELVLEAGQGYTIFVAGEQGIFTSVRALEE